MTLHLEEPQPQRVNLFPTPGPHLQESPLNMEALILATLLQRQVSLFNQKIDTTTLNFRFFLLNALTNIYFL